DQTDIDLVVVDSVRLVEATLRQAPIDRHLATLKARLRATLACRLALAAATGGLAKARADTAADALAVLPRAWIIGDLVEFHIRIPYSTTRTKCETLAIIPRTAGVSARVERLRILLSPRPTSVARCSAGRRCGLLTCSTTIVFDSDFFAFAM